MLLIVLILYIYIYIYIYIMGKPIHVWKSLKKHNCFFLAESECVSVITIFSDQDIYSHDNNIFWLFLYFGAILAPRK